MVKEYEYHSVFAPYIRSFIEMHRAQGFQYNEPAYELYRFDRFCFNCGVVEPVITKTLFEAWAVHKPPGSTEGKKGLYSRMSCLRMLSLFMNMLQITCYYPSRLSPPPKRLPYFMTDSDVKEFFDVLDNWKPTSPRRRFHQMHQEYRVLFRLYVCCGIRNAEGCELKSKNIYLNTGVNYYRSL